MGSENTTPQTLQEVILYFSEPHTCVEFMARMRWGSEGPACPRCEGKRLSFLQTRLMWKCLDCQKQFSVKVNSVFEDSPLGLDKWLCAMWMISNCRNGVSSYEISRDIQISRKSAWFMLQRIRHAMHTGTFEKLSGHVEADETFIGGKARFMHQDKRAEKITGTGGKGKTAVMGILERGRDGKPGKVRTKVIDSRKKKALQAEVRQHLEAGSALYTAP